MSKKGLKGLMFVILSSFLWAVTGIISKALFNEGGTPILMIFTRNMVGVFCLALFFCFYNRKLFRLNKAYLKPLILCSVFLFIYSASYFFSIYYLDVSVAMVLLYMYPTIVAVSSVFVFKERLTVKIIAALLLTACGMVLTLNLLSRGIGEVSSLGLLLSFSSAFGAAWYSIYVKKLSVAYHATTINFYGLLLTVFGYGILALFSLKNGFLSTPELAGSVAMAFPYVGGLLLFAIGVTYLSPSFASIFGSTEPVFGTVMAVIFLGDVISASQIAGIALVFSAIIILQLPFKRKRLDKEKEEERTKNTPCECPNTIHGV